MLICQYADRDFLAIHATPQPKFSLIQSYSWHIKIAVYSGIRKLYVSYCSKLSSFFHPILIPFCSSSCACSNNYPTNLVNVRYGFCKWIQLFSLDTKSWQNWFMMFYIITRNMYIYISTYNVHLLISFLCMNIYTFE
jgi:hypothetical protein